VSGYEQEPVAYRVRMDRPFGGVWQLRHVLHEWEKWDIVEPLYLAPFVYQGKDPDTINAEYEINFMDSRESK
jgi:hypothetical protein